MRAKELIQFYENGNRNFKGINLSGADLTGAELRKIDLSDSQLSQAIFKDADLNRANLQRTNLTEASLAGADLRKADLSKTNLTGANLAGADLRGAKLAGANLTGVNLREANLEKTDLRGANLSGADLTKTYIKDAQISVNQLAQASIFGEDKPPVNIKHKWREFLQHLGPYIMVMVALGIINALTSPEYPWFLFPAAAWGMGLSIHFWVVLFDSVPNFSGKWHNFFNHLASYISVIGGLGIINALTTSFPWFLFPAAFWGIGLGIHFWAVLISGSDGETTARPVEQAKPQQRSVEQPRMREAAVPKPAQRPPLARRTLTSKTLQMHLDKALAYREQIEGMITATSDQNASPRQQDLARQVNEWTQAVNDLAWRVDRFQQDPLIRHDLESVPQAIQELENRLMNETNAGARTELEHTLVNRKNQLAALKRLQGTMRRAEIQIESTLSALGTIYSQLLTGQSTDHVADYSRLSAEVDEEVRTLQDQLEALQEVKLGQG